MAINTAADLIFKYGARCQTHGLRQKGGIGQISLNEYSNK